MRRAPPAPDDPERLTRWREPGRAASTVDSTLRDIDRNLNTGHELGADAEMRPALQTIFHATRASRVPGGTDGAQVRPVRDACSRLLRPGVAARALSSPQLQPTGEDALDTPAGARRDPHLALARARHASHGQFGERRSMRLPEHRDYSRHLMEGANMNLIPLGDVELHYTSLTSLDYGAGGQNYGTMEGWLRGRVSFLVSCA